MFIYLAMYTISYFVPKKLNFVHLFQVFFYNKHGAHVFYNKHGAHVFIINMVLMCFIINLVLM